MNGQLGLPIYKKYEVISKNGKKSIENQKCATVFASPMVVDLPKDGPSPTNDDDNDAYENQYSPVAVAAGARHTIVKTEEGIILGAGWNRYGQLASHNLESDFDRFRIIDTNYLNVNLNEYSIVCGEWSSLLVSKY